MNTHLSSALQNIIYSIVVCFSVLSICVSQASAKDIYVNPTGVYATIDTSHDIKLMKVLMNGSPEQKAASVKFVLQSPTKFSPGVLFALSAALFEQGNKDESMFWFLVADLRARYDAQRCADVSARSGVQGLRQNFGQAIYPYMRKDTDKLADTLPKALAWDAAHAYNYDHRWINLHGLAAFAATSNPKAHPELSLPESEWPAIRSKVRSDFETGYKNSIVTLLKESNPTPKSQTKEVDKELMTACQANDLPTVKSALKRGANPNFRQIDHTPLHLAATAGNLEICKLLVSKGADVNASMQGITPLLCAARYCHPNVIEFLLKSKANPQVHNREGKTAILVLLTNLKRSDATSMKTKAITSDKDALEAIKILIAAGVDPNIGGGNYFQTPLIAAAQRGYTDIVGALLDGGAKINESDHGFTALHAAVSNSNLETVKLLVSRGANINASNNIQCTPLALAKKRTSEEIQKYLIAHGAQE